MVDRVSTELVNSIFSGSLAVFSSAFSFKSFALNTRIKTLRDLVNVVTGRLA